MARHDQREPVRKYVCTYCKHSECSSCIDITRIVAGLDTICDCTAKGHSGEPNDAQILDPETGTVYAPGLTVTHGGEVTFTCPSSIANGREDRCGLFSYPPRCREGNCTL